MGQAVPRVGALLFAGICALCACTSDEGGDSGDDGLPVMPVAGMAAGQAGSVASSGRGGNSAMGPAGMGAAGMAGTTSSNAMGGRGGMGSAGMAAAGRGGMGGAGGTTMAMGGTSGGAGSGSPSDRSPEGTCARWKADRMDLSEGTWSGSTTGCMVGDTTGRANALRLLNLYRWLADLPAVTTDPEFDRKAQACALLQRANNSLSHMPPESWTCYMAEGAEAAGRCNISTGPGVSSVAGYIVDPGNPMTIGHRRWILSNTFGPTGLGSTDRHSCMWTMGSSKLGRPWMAWPPPGPFPVQALSGGFGQNLDMTGWTVQSDTINLDAAQVTVMADGANQPVTVTKLLPGYGSRYAIRFNPMGWTTTAGKTYSVSVTGAAQPISYEVQVVACN